MDIEFIGSIIISITGIWLPIGIFINYLLPDRLMSVIAQPLSVAWVIFSWPITIIQVILKKRN